MSRTLRDYVSLSLAVKEKKVEKEINFDFLFDLVTKYTIEEKGILGFFADYEKKFRKGDFLARCRALGGRFAKNINL